MYLLIAEKDQRKKTNDDEDFMVDGKHWSVNSKRKRTLRYSEPEPESDGMLLITEQTKRLLGRLGRAVYKVNRKHQNNCV